MQEEYDFLPEDNHAENIDYQHGYTSGLEQLERSNYEGYLSSHVSLRHTQQRLSEKKQEIAQHQLLIAEQKSQQKAIFDIQQEHLLAINRQVKIIEFQEKLLETTRQYEQEYQEKYRQTTTQYSLMAGLLYLVAGFSFLFGDLVISHEIVAYALNIRNNFEAWAFAIGLAMLSVLLKPAYERLIEAPYLTAQPQAKRVYAWFKGGLVLFSVITLFILGWFRYEAYRTDKLKEGINKTIRNLQLQQTADGLAGSESVQNGLLGQMEVQMQKFEVLNQALVDSPWALASFVLSGILFALAGAVCLGISFPVLQVYWQRWLQLSPAMKKLQKQQKIQQDSLTIAHEMLNKHIVLRNIAENDLQLLPDWTLLQDHALRLEKETIELKEKIQLAETDARIGIYNDGFNRGDAIRDMMSQEEDQRFKNTYFSVQNIGNQKNTPTENLQSSIFANTLKKNSLRPYQAIRKIIAEQEL